eukprot:85671_1
MNMNKMNKLMINTSINNAPVMNQLKTMVLDVDKRNDCDINSCMTQNIIYTNTVTELTLFSFGKSNNKFDNLKFIQLLTKFPNINYLQFKGVYSDFDPNDIKKIISKFERFNIIFKYSSNKYVITSFICD